jgi:hypothetical protein
MGQVFLTVYDKKGRPVAAKTLVDASGNDVINPRTGQPLIVPRDYDINAAMAFGRSLKDLPHLPASEDPAGHVPNKYDAMRQAFQHGGPQDLQRSYNGMTGGGGDEFVPAFQHAASFHFGVVGRAAGLSPGEIVLGGGAFNLRNRKDNPNIDTSGPFFNNPDDFRMMQEGITGHDSGRFLRRTPSNEQSDNLVQVAVGRGLSSNGGSVVPQQLAAPQSGPPSDFASPGAGVLQRFDLPQRVIDAGNLLRANGIAITPRTVYVSHVLGPQAAVDLIKRTGSTTSPAVPSPDAATGDQMRAWVRALRLGPAAAAGTAGGMTPAPNGGPATPDQSSADAFDPTKPVA